MPRRIPVESAVSQIRLWGFEAADAKEGAEDNPFKDPNMLPKSHAGKLWERARQMRERWLMRKEDE